MRVKRSVDFRMAPKKATKGKGVAAEPTHDEGWNTSKYSQSDLDSLVSQGLLVPKSIIQWRPALGSDHPYEKVRGKSLLSPHTWNEDWGFLALLSFLDSCATTGSNCII